MKKEFSAEEVAKAVLNRCKEIADQNKIEKKEEVQKCGDMEKNQKEKKLRDDEKIRGHNMHLMRDEDAKLYNKRHKEYMKQGHDEIDAGYKALKEVEAQRTKRREMSKQEMDKCGDMNKSSKLKEWMKKKKKTDLKKMFGRTSTSAQGGGSTPPPAPAPGTSIADQIGFGKDEAGASKAMGLKPLASEKIKPPAADQMPEKPKAATTLKSYMAKRKKNG